MNLRCSSLPLALVCGASQRPPKLVIESRSEASELGTEVHRALQGMVERDTWDYNSLSDNAKWLVTAGFKAWMSLRLSVPDAQCEHELVATVITPEGTECELTGHCDVYSSRAGIVRILDWKTGAKDSDYSGQALGYCALALLLDTEVTEATCTLVWLRSAELETYTMRRGDLAEFLVQVDEVIDWSGRYVTGPHCEGCKRRHECDAQDAMAKTALAPWLSLRIPVGADLSNHPPQELVQIAQQASLVERLAKDVRAQIKNHIQAHGEIAGATHRLTIEVSEKRKLETWQAWPVLEQALTQQELAGVVDVSLSRAEALVAKNAGKGNGAAAIRELREKLEAAEAIKLIPEYRLVTRRK